MTKENTIYVAQQNIDCYFTAMGRRCKVVDVTSFGDEVHYQFQSVDNGKPIFGWVPYNLIGQCEYTK